MKNIDAFLKNRYDPINNRTISYYRDNRVERVLQLADKCTVPSKCLDIGCYDGDIAYKLSKKMGEKSEFYGIDVADNIQGEVESKGIKFKYNDLNKGIDFEDNYFDFVFAGEVIEHIYDTDYFMSEIKRVLKPSGILLLTTPNLVSFGRRIMYIFGKGVFMEASLTFPKGAAGHIRFFTRALLHDYLESLNFDIVASVGDEINIPKIRLKLLGRLFPTLSHHIIVKAVNNK